jgi:hypothetical protein
VESGKYIPESHHVSECSLPKIYELKINLYCCTVHYGICILFIHQQLHFLLNLEKFKFTWKYT